MAKRTREEDEGYTSDSTIDKPPVGEQAEIPGTEEEEGRSAVDSLEVPLDFNVTLTLVLKGNTGNPKPQQIPILHGDIPAEMVEEMLEKGVNSAYFRNRLRAIIGTTES